mgnify:CR=1 FL=1
MTDTTNIDMNKLKALLKEVVWDYNISEDELLEIFLQNKEGYSMNKADIEARLLGYYSWHHIIRVLGYKRASELLNDEAITRIFPKTYQTKLYGLRSILSEKTVPTPR